MTATTTGPIWIVGVDRTASSEHALRWCSTNARDRGVSLVLVNAWSQIAGEPDATRAIARPVERSEALLQRLQVEFDTSEIPMQVRALRGDPSDVLVAEADSADLLVLGRRSATGIRRHAMSSVSRKCATYSTTPVLAVPHTSDITAAPRRVVVGMDGSPNAVAALRWAMTFAPNDAHLTVIGTPDRRTRGVAESERQFNAGIDEAMTTSPTGERVVERLYKMAYPAVALTSETADLIVLGARGRGPLKAAFLGSVATTVLRTTSVPLAIVPAPSGGH